MSVDSFVWYELVTADVDAAIAFYGKLLGWEAQEFPAGDDRYTVLSAAGKGVGGVMALPAGMSHPFWLGYIGVADIDAAIAKLVGDGGTVHRGPWEIPGVGHLALVGDPQGAGIAMIQGTSPMPREAFDQQRPGHGQWHELQTTDPAAALGFYSRQFGWTTGPAMPMGPGMTYQIFEMNGVQAGGIMPPMGQMPPMWIYYFGVPSIASAVETIRQNGGEILNGPQEVPGGALVVQAKDPQGAVFALVGPET